MEEALFTLAHGVGDHLFLAPVSGAAGGETATAFAGLISMNMPKRHYFFFLSEHSTRLVFIET